MTRLVLTPKRLVALLISIEIDCHYNYDYRASISNARAKLVKAIASNDTDKIMPCCREIVEIIRENSPNRLNHYRDCFP